VSDITQTEAAQLRTSISATSKGLFEALSALDGALCDLEKRCEPIIAQLPRADDAEKDPTSVRPARSSVRGDLWSCECGCINSGSDVFCYRCGSGQRSPRQFCYRCGSGEPA